MSSAFVVVYFPDEDLEDRWAEGAEEGKLRRVGCNCVLEEERRGHDQCE
jgi:hypothetical protein